MLSVVKIPADRSIDEESAAEFVIKLLAVSKSPSGSGHMESADGWFVCVFLRDVGAKASVAWGSAHTQTDISRVEIFMAVLKVFVSLHA